MGLFSFRSNKKSSDETAGLRNVLEKGDYYDAVKAAEKLIASGDCSCADLMISRMRDYRMAVPLSRIPDEKVILPLILEISRYAILNLNVASGSEKFQPLYVSQIFRNLLNSFGDKVIAYLAEIREYNFFFLKDGCLLYTRGRQSFGPHLDRPDQVAICARDVLAPISEDRIKTERERGRENYKKANLSEREIRELL